MQQRFYNRIVAELTDLMAQRDIRQLILVGPVQRVAEFKAELPATAPFELIGETNVTGGAGWVNPADILEKIQPMLHAHREATEQALLDQIQERGVMEMEPVLEMLQQARLYQMVIPEDGSDVHLYRSNNRDVPYFTSRKDVPHSPLDDSVMERVTLEELLPDLIDLYGIEVRRVHGDHAQRLVREFGGLAALPRYLWSEPAPARKGFHAEEAVSPCIPCFPRLACPPAHHRDSAEEHQGLQGKKQRPAYSGHHHLLQRNAALQMTLAQSRLRKCLHAASRGAGLAHADGTGNQEQQVPAPFQ